MVVPVTVGVKEGMEQVAAPAGRDRDISSLAKGKRTKRQRPHSPIPFATTPPPPNARETAADDDVYRSPTSSSEESTTTEEVITARCLILLSRGHFSNSDRRYDEAATTSYGGATKAAGGGACVYTCKTCDRSFPSFQALGGHRASHKKPRNEKKLAMFSDEEDFPSPNSLSLQLSSGSTATFSARMKSSPSPRIHVCSHCGAEFTSGQALGGHMRKHRGAAPISRSFNLPPEASVDELEPEESKKLGIGLALDLNLPAPLDDREKSPKETTQRFSPPLLRH